MKKKRARISVYQENEITIAVFEFVEAPLRSYCKLTPSSIQRLAFVIEKEVSRGAYLRPFLSTTLGYTLRFVPF